MLITPLIHFCVVVYLIYALIDICSFDADHPPLQLVFVHLCLEEISMGVYWKAHWVVKYLKLKWMNPSIEHNELMLA